MDRKYLLILLSLMAIASPSLAEIYKWVDENGKTHLTDRPPRNSDAKPIKVRIINTFTTPQIVSAPPTARQTQKSSVRKKVVMYSTQSCGVCKKAKAYFRSKRIPFSEYDVQTSSKGRRDYKRLNGRGVPIILVGNARMNGFSSGGFERLYGGS